MVKKIKVYIQVVSFNNKATICSCLEAALSQKGPLEISLYVIDNTSTDGTKELLESQFASRVSLEFSAVNLGFAAGHNRGLTQALKNGADYIMLLNPDVRLQENTLEHLVAALEADSLAGFATPRIYRADDNLEAAVPEKFDAAGMYMTTSIRHFDRGSNILDNGQYRKAEYVFGGTGACLLIRASAATDCALPGDGENVQLFDESFFIYREDADLAWRALWFGWKCRYVPEAVCFHKRQVLPDNRSSVSKTINYHSVKNRFLLQLNNFSFLANFHCLLPTLARNIVVFFGVLITEQSSLAAFREVFRALPEALKKRKFIAAKRRLGPSELSSWFSKKTFSEPVISHKPVTKISSLDVLIVNYNSDKRVIAAAKSVLESFKDIPKDVTAKLSVIDNASTDFPDNEFGEITSYLELHRGKVNLGFAGAINAQLLKTKADALLILNPDVILQKNCLAKMLAGLEKYPELAVLSPTLESADNKVQHGFVAKRLPTFSSCLAELFFLHHLWPNNPWTGRFFYREHSILKNYLEQTFTPESGPYLSSAEPFIVEQPAGACLLIRTEDAKAIGGFDDEFFPAWFEDVDFCKGLIASGRLAAVLAEARATHEGGYSAKHLGRQNFSEIWYKNLLLYWKKHGTVLQYFTFRCLVPIASLLRKVVSSFRLAATK